MAQWNPGEPPGPVVVRPRTNRLRDMWTGLPRPAPEECTVSLDYFQRTFPEVTTQEHILVRRWEDIALMLGGADSANELVQEDPSVLRVPIARPRRSFHYLCMYLGPQVARKTVMRTPWLLTKLGGRMRKALPALLNVFGTKQRLAEIAEEYPMLMHVPTGDFYKGLAGMIAVCGNPERALEVGKEAMARIAASPQRSVVPEAYPTLVAIYGGLNEAHAAIEREPLLLQHLGEQFLGKLLTLRRLLGRDGAQEAVKKAPFLLLYEKQRKSHKFNLVYEALERLFGEEETIHRLVANPELLSLGVCLKRALRFAERKYGSPEAVRDNFETVLRRTGLQEHLENWEMLPRPRRGYWSQRTQLPLGYPPNLCSWAPQMNPGGPSAVARGRWDEVVEDVDAAGGPAQEAELLLQPGSAS